MEGLLKYYFRIWSARRLKFPSHALLSLNQLRGHTVPSFFHALKAKVLGRFWPAITTVYRGLTSRLDPATLDLVLVLGNQKTGSTAIARLLAVWGNLNAVTDVHSLQASRVRLPNQPAAVEEFLQRARYYFRHDLVKENALTPATDALLNVLPCARPVYVVRHPVHNVRSILDRLGLPGTPRSLRSLDLSDGGWRPIVENRHFDGDADDHITSLAQRWAETTAIYRRHRDRLTLVRYEDFMADKEGCIRQLSDRLNVPQENDIRPLLDVPFQPRGQHRSVPPASFFSAEGLAIINRECADGMDALDYDPIAPASNA